MDKINTLTQFDLEVAKAYKTDKFYIKRLDGLLDVKQLWNQWLCYKQYGTTRKSSAQAQAQGGRQEEPMCMRFFKGKDVPNRDVVLMQYKYKESDLYWMPYSCEGIPVYSDHALALGEGMFTAPPICPPKPWPEADKIRRHLLEQANMSEQERQEWRVFFDNVPIQASDISEQKRFKWGLPEMAARFQAARASPPPAPGARVGESTRPDKPDERIIHPGFTSADHRRAEKQRAANYSREQHALHQRQRSEHMSQQLEPEPPANGNTSESDPESSVSSDESEDLPRACRRRQNQVSDAGPSATSLPRSRATSSTTSTAPPRRSKKAKTSSSTCIAMGDSGVIDIGDVVMFSPDEDSREADRANNYKLGICLGKVVDIDPSKRSVQLWWFHGNGWSKKSRWVEWRDPTTKAPYKDWVDVELLLVDSFGTLAKVQFEKKSNTGFGVLTLTQHSIKVIKDVLETNEDLDE